MSGEFNIQMQIAPMANVEKVVHAVQSQPLMQQQAAQEAATEIFRREQGQVARGTEIKKDRAVRSRKEHESHKSPQDFSGKRRQKSMEEALQEVDCATAGSESEIWTGNILDIKI